MAQLTKKLMEPFKAVSPEGMSKTAKACRECAARFSEAADLLAGAATSFEDNSFETGFELLQRADERLSKKT